MKRFFFFIFCIHAVHSIAQVKYDPELERRLSGKEKFVDIKATVVSYYEEKINGLSPGDSIEKKKLRRMNKMWNRVLFDAESHLDEEGKVVNAAKRNFDQLLSAGRLGEPPIAQSTETTYGSWSLIGPTSVTEGIGRINRIAFDPSSSNTIYAGSSGGGLFRTTNAGISWSNVASFLPSLGISGIVLTNSNTIYILTGDGDAQSSGGFTFKYGYIRYSVGVLKSTDGGSTWQPTAPFPGLNTNDHYSGMKLVRDPNDPNTLLAATTMGLFRTTNGGDSWTQALLVGSSSNSVMVYDVEYAPGNSSIAYCAVQYNGDSDNGVFLRSTNGGSTFSGANGINYSPDEFDNVERISIAVSPANANAVYILAGPGVPSPSTYKGLWYSSDQGQNFTRKSNSPNVLGKLEEDDYPDQNFYDMALAVSPTNVNTVVAGGLVIFRSTTGGAFFAQETPYHGSASIHPDVHELIYNPANGNLYAGTDGGVAVSDDNGVTWTKLFVGLSCTQFYHFGVQDDEGNLWGGAQDNGVLVKTGSGSAFDRYAGGDGYDVMTDMAPAGNQDDIYYVVNTNIMADATIDEDITPSQVNINSSSNFFPNLAMSPTNEDVIYAGYPVLYVSYSRGDNWADIGSPKVPGNWCVSTCPTNRKRVYAAGTRSGSGFATGLFRVDNLDDVIPDAVTDLTAALESAGYPSDNPKITDIQVSSNTSARVYVTISGYRTGKKVFVTNNSGANWDNISGSLPNLPVNCIVTDDNDNMYIGTDIGVYYRGASDADWTPFYNGLPRVAVSELEFLPLVGGGAFLYASTYGRGIWASETFTSCATDLTISSNQVGQKFYQASSTISSTSSVNGGIGTNVYFKAGSSITLEEGFIVNHGTEFTGYIGPCNNDVPLRTVNGDSIIHIVKNTRAARQYGMVHDATVRQNNLLASLNIFNPGNYTIRIFDVMQNKYVASLLQLYMAGTKNTTIPIDPAWGKYLRIDLFSGDILVHSHDIETSQ